jgi:hypothetical protein
MYTIGEKACSFELAKELVSILTNYPLNSKNPNE